MTITKTRKGEYALLAFKLLKEAGGDLHNRELLAAMEGQLNLSEEERHVYDGGRPRWDVHVRFISTGAAKAGFIRKKSGRWYLTPEGEALLGKSPDNVYDAINERYHVWREKRDVERALDSPETSEEERPDETSALVLEDAEDRARQEIREFISAMGPYEFQDLVAALLRSMGYVTPFVAPQGPDAVRTFWPISTRSAPRRRIFGFR